MESVYSKRIRAGKRRTYFFDVRATRSKDYYLTITESRKKFNEDGYDRHKIFLYKEDFNKFLKALTEAVDYVKTDLMPDFDFDAYNHDNVAENEGGYQEGPGYQESTREVRKTMPEIPEEIRDYIKNSPEMIASRDERAVPDDDPVPSPATAGHRTPPGHGQGCAMHFTRCEGERK